MVRAVGAQKIWKDSTIAQRVSALGKIEESLLANAHIWGQILTQEMGKPIQQAIAELEKCASACTYYAQHLEVFLAPEHIKTEYTESFVIKQPVGIAFAIMPWNFPFWQVIRQAIPAIAAGNAVVLKHASNVPQCAMLLQALFNIKDFPTHLFQTLLIKADQVEEVIKYKEVGIVSFTGSNFAGEQVAALAGKHLKKTVMELGGSDPFIVLSDASLDFTVKSAIAARMQNNGQSCIAAKRIIVVQEVYAEFVKKIKIAMQNLRTGDPSDPKVDLGPLAKLEFCEVLQAQVDSSIAQGAVLLLGGTHQNGIFQATLLVDVLPHMEVFTEETFGPVLCVTKANDVQHALALANESKFGLGASIWTQNIEKAKSLAGQIESGSVFINSIVKSDARLPFGGTKQSGYHRELSLAGFNQFVNLKTVAIA